MNQRHPNTKRKTDSAPLPDDPPLELSTDGEQRAYRDLLALLRKHAWTEAVDLAALVLAAQRLAHVRVCRALVNKAQEAGQWFTESASGAIKAHPILAELRGAEHALNQSLGSLYLTPRARNNARTGGNGEVDQNPSMTPDEKEAHDDLLK